MSDPIEVRPGFSEMLSRIESNGVRLMLVEDASRLARSVLVSELAIVVMAQCGVRITSMLEQNAVSANDDTGAPKLTQDFFFWAQQGTVPS